MPWGAKFTGQAPVQARGGGGYGSRFSGGAVPIVHGGPTPAAKGKGGGPSLFGIPLLSPGHLPSWTGQALAPAEWAGEKLGILPHALARIPYVLEQAIPSAAAHPVKTTEQIGGAIKGMGELGFALEKAAASHPGSLSGLLNPATAGTTLGALLAQNPKGTLGKVKKAGGALLYSTETDYKNRYGPQWQKYAQAEPFNNLMDALTILGGATRGAAMAGAATRLDPEAARLATLLKHPRAVWKESGNFDPRVLEHTTPEGTKLTSVQPTSRSPLRAGTQQLGDILSRKYPEMPGFGVQARVTRAQSQQIGRTISRALASIPGIDAVGRLKGPEADRVFWGANMGGFDATTLRRLRDAVRNVQDAPIAAEDPAFAQHLFEAKQAGFGPGMLDSIDRAIAHAEKNPEIVAGSKMDNAIRALEHSTQMTEQTLLDHGGFSGINQEIARVEQSLAQVAGNPDAEARVEAQLQKLMAERDAMRTAHSNMFDARRSLVSDWVNANTKVVSPIRTAIRADLLKAWKDPAQVDNVLKINDAMAVRFRPHDPASWYADRVGMPTGESATAFLRRMEAMSPQERGRLYQYMLGPYGAEKAGMYSTPLVDAVDKMQPTMTVGQLRKYLEKARVVDGELLHSGVQSFLDTKTLGDKVTKAELQQILASPDNAFHGLVEHHWVNDGTGESPPFLYETKGGINSRYAAPGEYHMHAVGLNPEGPTRYGEHLLDEPGRGAIHTEGRTNVIGHTRYHIFEDPHTGKMTMLVEEAQSDWARDFARESQLRGPNKEPSRLPTAEEQSRLNDLNAERQYLNNEFESTDAHAFDLHNQYEDARAAGDRVAMDSLRQELNAANTAVHNVQAKIYEVMSEHEQLTSTMAGRLAQSPLGSKRFLDTLANRLVQEAHSQGVERIVIADGPTQSVRNMPATSTHLIPWDASTAEIASRVRGEFPTGKFVTMYEKDLPKAIAKAAGGTFHHEHEAYTGEFRNAYVHHLSSEEGPMSGTVIDFGKPQHANAEGIRALYQQADRGRLPKGATEFFQDGTSAIRMFKGGDVTTYLHELSHVALHDLPDAERALLEKHFGDGLPVEQWTNDMHEEYAKSFERYMATGQAPTRALEGVFAKISAWMSALWKTAKEDIPDIHPEVRQAFDAMFSDPNHPQIFMPHRAMGVSLSGVRTTQGIPRGGAGGDIGDQALAQAGSFRRNTLSLMRSGMINPDPRLALEHANRTMMVARSNSLRDAVTALSKPLEPGDMLAGRFDPKTQYVVKRAGTSADKPLFQALENADHPEQIRSLIADYVDNNISSDPSMIAKWQAELAADPTGPYSHALVDKATVDHLFKNVTGKTPGATTRPLGAAGRVWDAALDSVRGLLLYSNPGFYVANMAGNSLMMMMSDPRAARYLPWAMKEAFKGVGGRGDQADPLWHRIATEMGRGPTSGGLSERRPVLLGQGSRVKGLGKESWLERRDRVAHVLSNDKRAIPGRVAGNVSHFWGAMGRGSGRVIDDSFRVAAWRQEAAKLGYGSDKQVTALLDAAVRDGRKGMLEAHSKPMRDLNSIRDSAEQLMLDFDSMTPFEKQYLTRTLFLYPFTKAAAKYPFMYAGERPLAAGLLGQAGAQANLFANQVMPPDKNLPLWMRDYARTPWGYMPIGSVSSFQPLSQLLASAGNISGQQELGISTPIEYANPMIQMLVDMARQQNKFGRSQSMWKTLGQEFPAPAYVKQVFGHPPGKIYADRGFLATLERALRGPFQINAAQAQKQANLSGRKNVPAPSAPTPAPAQGSGTPKRGYGSRFGS